jgi:hypothetical protein
MATPTGDRFKTRGIWIGFGLLLILIGVFLPTGWYDSLPKSKEQLPDPPMSGATLVRLCFGLEGVFLVLAGMMGGFRLYLHERDCVRLPEPVPSLGDDLRHPVRLVACATAVAALLRFHAIGSDLWLDEITTVLDYQHMSPLHVIAAYVSSNNHLLNTLLIKAMIRVAGNLEWAIRLPAVLAGIACIPAQYYLARVALARRESVLAMLLLAVSYHHIFFSQNARGYTGYLLWSLLGTTLFLRAISKGSTRYWLLYILCMFLGMATMLYAGFVVMGHMLVFIVACWWLRHRSQPVLPLVRAAGIAWAILGVLSFHLYASSLPQVYVLMNTVYRTAGDGYSLLSLEYLNELKRGISAGLGNGASFAAAVVLMVMGAGFLAFLRRHPLYGATLVAPLVVTCAFVLSLRLIILPRSLLWGLPIGYIFATATLVTVSRWLRAHVSARPWQWLAAQAPLALTGLLMLLSLWSLPAYYRAPKQANRQSLRWVLEHKQPGDVLVTVFAAEWGARYYGPGLGLREDVDFQRVRSLPQLEAMERTNTGRTIWLLTTIDRGLRREFPELSRRIREKYDLRAMFPGTIGDGDIHVWSRVPSR